jgi:signal transduction histidine kinase
LLQGSAESSLARDVADKIAYHARRTLELAENFVQLARLRETSFTPEETDLHDCLGEASDALWPLASKKGVRIIVRPGEPCCVAGERHALTRAFLNLLDNAVRFSPAGAEIHCGVAVATAEGAPMFEAWIEDHGAGIPEERLADLTGRFGPLAARPGRSVGLGLAYVRAVAERHGGRLDYAPVSPHGSRFALVLPEFADSVSR